MKYQIWKMKKLHVEPTDRARFEGVGVGSLELCHSISHVGIAWQIQILNKNPSCTFWDLKSDCASGHIHVWFIRETSYIVFEHYLLVTHFFTITCHCCLTSLYTNTAHIYEKRGEKSVGTHAHIYIYMHLCLYIWKSVLYWEVTAQDA